MGANAVTTVPVYTAGEVLTAADMNITNSGIPVFATTVTRDAAFGGAGEKTLAEGQFAYIEATNTTQYYDGAAWQSVGVAPGLVYLTGATFTAAASVSLPTSTFTSAYENYRLHFVVQSVSTTMTLTMRMRAAGSDSTAASYSGGMLGIMNTGGSISMVNDNDNKWWVSGSDAGAQAAKFAYDIIGPEVTQKTAVTGTIVGGQQGANGFGGAVFGGFFNATTSFDSLSVIASTGNISGYYKVYAYVNS
jgi:hypothetical protein